MSKRSLTDGDLSPFLKTYMLGVVSNLNDMLQDHHGKKSFSAKKQILRGLEALISQIGPDVHGISPQVQNFATFQ